MKPQNHETRNGTFQLSTTWCGQAKVYWYLLETMNSEKCAALIMQQDAAKWSWAITSIRCHRKPISTTIIQVCSPTTDGEKETKSLSSVQVETDQTSEQTVLITVTRKQKSEVNVNQILSVSLT